MQVKDIITDVMRMVGRYDAAEECEGGESLSTDVSRMQSAMLLCLNSVVDELARGYFPVMAVESKSSSGGEIAFSSFSHTPFRIVHVRGGDGEKVKWTLTPFKLLCPAGKVEVEYEYVPDSFALDDEFSYPDPAVGHTLVSFGTAAEYMLIAGDIASAEMWEGKYRTEIDRLLALSQVRDKIPPRRWI